MSSMTQVRHPYLVASVLQRENKSIDQVLTTLPNFTNPFKEEGDELFNLVTSHGKGAFQNLPERSNSFAESEPLVPDEETQTAYVERQRKSTESIWYGSSEGVTGGQISARKTDGSIQEQT